MKWFSNITTNVFGLGEGTNRKLNRKTKLDMSTNDDLKNETANCGNTVLPAVLFVGAKLYRTNYNDITEVVTIERVTKTQAISKNGTYKFGIEVSSYGTARKLGNTDSWSSASFYLETPKLKEQLWKKKTVKKLKDTDYSNLSTEVLKELLSLVNGR